MQCPKCRAAMPNGAKYCTECGAKLPVQPDSVPNVPQPAIQEAPAYEAQPVMTEAASAVQEWFKFLIYFALWSGGILTALYSFAYFTGTVLGIGIDAELVYSYYPLLRVFHIFCGLENIAYGVFAIYTRYRLAQFRRNGPACLYALYIAQFVFALLVQVVTSLILGEWLEGYSFVANFLVFGLILGLNMKYFRKRKHLFVN